MDFVKIWEQIQPIIIQYSLRVIGAIIVWVVGRWVISLIVKLLRRALMAREVDPTLQKYLGSIVGVSLNVLLAIAILAQFGIETTSFAALIAAAGLAIGTAWGGLLANFAAGAFLLVLRPFRVGDIIGAAGTVGVVEEIGLFATTLMTPDGIRTFVGNNKLFGDNIQNYTDTPYRRMERTMQLANGVDVDDAIERLGKAVAAIPGVLAQPAPLIGVSDYTLSGPVLSIRPYCKPADALAVQASINEVVRRVSKEAGYPAPEVAYVVRQA